MLIENMSDQEVLAQYIKDSEDVNDRIIHHVMNVTRRKAIETKKFPFSDGYHCKTDNGNDYYIVSVICNKYDLKKRNISSVIGCIINTERGKMFVQIICDKQNEYSICWYTAHFFRRYAERMGMNKDAPMKDILITFFTRNPELSQEIKFTIKGGEKRFMACFRDGIGMAQIKNNKEVMMTFLPNDLLNRTQSSRREILEEIRQKFEDEKKRNGELL